VVDRRLRKAEATGSNPVKSIMEKALGNMGKAKKSIVPRKSSRISGDDLMDLKLHAAQEILAEVFSITVAEAEEMIKQRSKERMLWPEIFQQEKA
jgi:hypothetical protein